MIPFAYAGEAGARILKLDTGHQDAAEGVDFKVESGAVAPAGLGGDVAFDRFRLSITWTMATTITITPILDGEDLAETHIISLEAQTERKSQPFELVFRRVSSTNRSYAVRGTWLALRIEGTVGDGELIIDPGLLEYEVLTPTQTRSEGP